MYNVSDDFKAAAVSTDRYETGTVTIGSTTLTAGSINDITVTDPLCEESFTVGSFPTRTCVLTMISEDIPTTIAGEAISPSLGISVGNTIESVPMGVFYATKGGIAHKNLLTVITCYDKSWYLTGQYSTDLTNARDILDDICDETGITLSGNFGYLDPSDITVHAEISGTYREVIAHIALLLGCNARFDRDGNLDFVQASTSGDPVMAYGTSCYRSSDYRLESDEAGTIQSIEVNYTRDVTTGSGDDEETETETDTYYYTVGANGKLTINTNGIINQAETTALGQAILGEDGLSYYSFSVTMIGQPHVEAGDLISLVEPLGDTYEFLVLNAETAYDGSIKTTFSATIAEEDTTVEDNPLTGQGTLTSQVETLTKALNNLRLSMLNVDFLEARKAKIADLVANNLTVGSINGNVITNGSILAAALSSSAVQTLSGTHVYYQAEEPEDNLVEGDIWYHTVVDETEENVWTDNVSVYDGSEWVTTPMDASMLVAGSITAREIAADTITASKIDMDSLQTNLARVGSEDGGHIAIDSDSIDLMSGTTQYATFELTNLGMPQVALERGSYNAKLGADGVTVTNGDDNTTVTAAEIRTPSLRSSSISGKSIKAIDGTDETDILPTGITTPKVTTDELVLTSPIVKVTSQTFNSLTVNANTSTTLTLTPTAQSGYTLAGVMGINSSGTGSTSITPYRWVITTDKTGVGITLRNTTTKTTSYSLTLQLLWIKG